MIGFDARAQDPPIVVSGEGPCLLEELIYALDGRVTPQCHASTIVESPSGLAVAWFGGSYENHPDVGIWFSRQQNGKWTSPVEVVDGTEGEDNDYACWNPVLFQPKAGPLAVPARSRLVGLRWLTVHSQLDAHGLAGGCLWQYDHRDGIVGNGRFQRRRQVEHQARFVE